MRLQPVHSSYNFQYNFSSFPDTPSSSSFSTMVVNVITLPSSIHVCLCGGGVFSPTAETVFIKRRATLPDVFTGTKLFSTGHSPTNTAGCTQ